jgi:hypothetical protein
MGYPHRHRIIAFKDVKNEHGRTMRIRVIENWPGTRYWLARSYVEPDGTTQYRRVFDVEPSTSNKSVAESWEKNLQNLAWDDSIFQKKKLAEEKKEKAIESKLKPLVEAYARTHGAIRHPVTALRDEHIIPTRYGRFVTHVRGDSIYGRFENPREAQEENLTGPSGKLNVMGSAGRSAESIFGEWKMRMDYLVEPSGSPRRNIRTTRHASRSANPDALGSLVHKAVTKVARAFKR